MISVVLFIYFFCGCIKAHNTTSSITFVKCDGKCCTECFNQVEFSVFILSELYISFGITKFRLMSR